jgi:selenocysteine lyase/cysteine desulfurase
MLNLAQLRADTPGVDHRLHLNNAGASLMPRSVLDVMQEYLKRESEIGGYETADEREDVIAASYDELAALIGTKPENVAVVANATAAFVQAMSSFDFVAGDTIITSRCDYTSNQIQYASLTARLGVRIEHAADLPEGGIDPDDVKRLIQQRRPRVVAVSWIPTNSGLVQDVDAVGRICEEFDVPFIVDACQAVGQIPIDLRTLRCDYLSATARKFMRGPRGIGFLYASDRALSRGDHPLYVDMRGARWTGVNQYEVAPTARRYEDWEFPYTQVVGQGEAARYTRAVGVEAARDRAWELARVLRDRLASLPDVEVLDRGMTRCAIVTAYSKRVPADRIVKELTRRGINTVLTLREYGILDFDAKGVSAAIRVSPHYYNTDLEIETFLGAIEEILASA